jgi:hypothetical protein
MRVLGARTNGVLDLLVLMLMLILVLVMMVLEKGLNMRVAVREGSEWRRN